MPYYARSRYTPTESMTEASGPEIPAYDGSSADFIRGLVADEQRELSRSRRTRGRGRGGGGGGMVTRQPTPGAVSQMGSGSSPQGIDNRRARLALQRDRAATRDVLMRQQTMGRAAPQKIATVGMQTFRTLKDPHAMTGYERELFLPENANMVASPAEARTGGIGGRSGTRAYEQHSDNIAGYGGVAGAGGTTGSFGGSGVSGRTTRYAEGEVGAERVGRGGQDFSRQPRRRSNIRYGGLHG